MARRSSHARGKAQKSSFPTSWPEATRSSRASSRRSSRIASSRSPISAHVAGETSRRLRSDPQSDRRVQRRRRRARDRAGRHVSHRADPPEEQRQSASGAKASTLLFKTDPKPICRWSSRAGRAWSATTTRRSSTRWSRRTSPSPARARSTGRPSKQNWWGWTAPARSHGVATGSRMTGRARTSRSSSASLATAISCGRTSSSPTAARTS